MNVFSRYGAAGGWRLAHGLDCFGQVIPQFVACATRPEAPYRAVCRRRAGLALHECRKAGEKSRFEPRVRIALRPYQQEIFDDRSSGILILHWSRQIGKSFTLAAWAVDRLLTRPGRLVTVLSNSRENGAEFVSKCAEVCRLNGTEYTSVDKSRGLRFQNMRMEVRIRAKGKTGRIKVLAANPRTARGFSGDLILDEFAFHEDSNAIWEAAEPILASNPDFLCRMASTGNGKHNLFYRMVEGIQEVRNAECGLRSEDLPSPGSGATSGIEDGKEVRNAECGRLRSEAMAGQGVRSEDLPSPGFHLRGVSAGRVGATSGGEDGPASARKLRRAEGSKVEDGELADQDEVCVGNVRPHPGPMASQARHQFVAPYYETASRHVVPQERESVRTSEESSGAMDALALAGLEPETPSPRPLPQGGEGEETRAPMQRSRAGFAVSRITRTEAHAMGVKIYDANTRVAVSPEEARAQAMDKRAYDQNYECVFADENATLLSHELINAAEREDVGVICENDWGNALVVPALAGPVGGFKDRLKPGLQALELLRSALGPLFVGFDVARKGDLSVITVIEELNGMKMVRAILRMRDLRLPEQQQRLGEICRLPKFRRAAIDMTGLGLGLFEYAQEEFGASRIHGINFATSVPATRAVQREGRKREMVRVTEAMAMELLQTYEDRRIQHPADNRLRDDLRKPEKITTPGGRVSIAATRDEAGHADHFWSFALALEAASHGGGTGKIGVRLVERRRKSYGI